MTDDHLVLGFRFGVSFLAQGRVPNHIDTRFQRVSGLGASVQVRNHDEGGQNLYSHRLPERIAYENLVLERGKTVGSLITRDFDAAMSRFSFQPCSVLVTLYDEAVAPKMCWMFYKAYPVRWRITDLNANETAVAIETLELAYARMQTVEV